LKNKSFTFLEVSSALSDAFVSGIRNVGVTDGCPPCADAVLFGFVFSV